MHEHCACDTYQRALALHHEGHCKQAIVEILHRVRSHRNEGTSWELLGILLFADGKFRWAQSAIEHASVLAPLSARAQILLARCYEVSKFVESAAVIYRHLATCEQLETGMLESLARGLGQIGELELALRVCREAAERMPDHAEPLVGMVHYMRRLNRPVEQIVPVMMRAYRLEPNSSEYCIILAWLLHEAGQTFAAARLLSQLSYANLHCAACLTRMQRIFEITGSERNASRCRQRLQALTNECSLRNDHNH